MAGPDARTTTGPTLLPLVETGTPERADAVRNREAVLCAAQALVREQGVETVTMDEVAARAGVGKGTVFRRYGSREGLMIALLNESEAEWQAAVISGPPPLGPGADPWDRLVAFGRSRLESSVRHADLLRAAGALGSRSIAAYSFTQQHTRILLTELGVTGDVPLLASALMAPLEGVVVHQQVRVEGIDLDRLHAGWVDLARRIVGRPGAGPGNDVDG